jgi:hypothetical protein
MVIYLVESGGMISFDKHFVSSIRVFIQTVMINM